MKMVRAAWAEYHSGPGWANRLVMVLLRDDITGELSLEALQPDEHTNAMTTLLPVSAYTVKRMANEARKVIDV